MNVHGLRRQRALVAEHLHAVDEVADAVGLRADELRQRPILVLDTGLQQLRGTADARERVLDLVSEHRRHARHRARRRTMGELALDHLRHRALLQHQHDQARLLGDASGEHVDQAVHAAARQIDLDAVLVDGGAGLAHLSDQCAERAREGDDVGQRLALQHAVTEREERLRREVGIEHAVVVPEHQNRVRQGGEQQIVLDVPALARSRPGVACRVVHAAITWAWS